MNNSPSMRGGGFKSILAIVGLLVFSPIAPAQPEKPEASPAPATQPSTLPHITIDRANLRLDLEGVVVLREADWLELLACSPKSREHESILTIAARPSHIHLALLTLGLEPGSPRKSWREGDTPKWSESFGPKVAVTLVYEAEGKRVEVGANEWILNKKTNEPLKGNALIFTGSRMIPIEGKEVYLADLNGTVLSLVNFGDDLLVRQTPLTNDTDEESIGVNTKAVPPIGTKVTVRLTVVKEEKPAATQPGK